MDLGAAGLNKQPFPAEGDSTAMISYDAARACLEVLENTYAAPHGLAVLQGPALSGKSTIIRCFINSLHEDCAVATIDGSELESSELLGELLRQFGYEVDLESPAELIGLIRVFAQQQAAHHEPPLLVVENTHLLRPDALRAICEMAELRTKTGSALKIVLVSDRSFQPILTAPAMKRI